MISERGEFTLRNLEHAFVTYFLVADMGHLPLTDEQRVLLAAIRAHRGNLERRGWESPFRWSWWRHPILAFRQWRARSTPPPRREDVAAMLAQMPAVAMADEHLKKTARHGLLRSASWAEQSRHYRAWMATQEAAP